MPTNSDFLPPVEQNEIHGWNFHPAPSFSQRAVLIVSVNRSKLELFINAQVIRPKSHIIFDIIILSQDSYIQRGKNCIILFKKRTIKEIIFPRYESYLEIHTFLILRNIFRYENIPRIVIKHWLIESIRERWRYGVHRIQEKERKKKKKSLTRPLITRRRSSK